MAFTELISSETYRMRTSPTYRGDYVENRVRRINGKRFEASRVFWADGTVTVSVTPYNRTNRLHEWQGRPTPLACGHVPSYGCDCDTIHAEADDQDQDDTITRCDKRPATCDTRPDTDLDCVWHT